jgi:hypothetical protein
VVGDQVLRLADQPGQLADDAVAPGQLTQEAPTKGMPGQLKELGRSDVRVKLLRTHSPKYASINIDTSSQFDASHLAEDPSRNLIELFEAIVPEARLIAER